MRYMLACLVGTLSCNASDGVRFPASTVEIESADCRSTSQANFVAALRKRDSLDDDLANQLQGILREEYGSVISCITSNAVHDCSCTTIAVTLSGVKTPIDSCAYIGERVIVCAGDFLRTSLDAAFTAELGHLPEVQHYRAFWSWVVGHEIAHLIRGDSDAHFLQADAPPTSRAWHKAKQFHAQEFSADSFFTKHHDYQKVAILEDVLKLIFAHAYSTSYSAPPVESSYCRGTCCYDLRQNPDPRVQIPYILESTHPAMVIRAALVLNGIASELSTQTQSQFFIDRYSGGLVHELARTSSWSRMTVEEYRWRSENPFICNPQYRDD